MKRLAFVQRQDLGHWVGDGFPVRSVFSYHEHSAALSPFLLLDYAGPAEFSPSERRRGVAEHPHRGFETVTIVYDGEVEHRDSSGGGGIIGPGDVQWMTAGAGIVHEEFHSLAFSRRGGRFEVVQLWVNLPAQDKMALPRYQPILGSDIPSVEISAGTVRPIAGEFAGRRGPAHTFTPINLWDVRLDADTRAEFIVPAGHTVAVFVRSGSVVLDGTRVEEAAAAVLGREGDSLALTAEQHAALLILTGEPIEEPVVGYGPFVMNSEREIEQAIVDYRSGKMGRLRAEERVKTKLS